MSNLFDADQKYKSLSIILLGFAVLDRFAAFVTLLQSGHYNRVLLPLNCIIQIACLFVPPILLICYLLSERRNQKLPLFALALVAIGSFFYSLWPLLYCLTEGIFSHFTSVMTAFAPNSIVNFSELIVALIVLGEICNDSKNTLPWICLAEAIVLLAYAGYYVIVKSTLVSAIFTLDISMLWVALFIMTKYDLIPFKNNDKHCQIASTTEDLRKLKVLFETNQISEDEYKRRKAIILNIR